VKIGIVVGSIRDRRRGEPVGEWVGAIASQRTDASFEMLDVRDFDLPMLTAPIGPAVANREYESETVRRWSAAIDACDGFVFVTPEYNHGVPGAFKNAFDLLAPEWQHKTVGFVSYGSVGGVRAVEQWRQIVGTFQMQDLVDNVTIRNVTEFDEQWELVPSESRDLALHKLLDNLVTTTRIRLLGEAALNAAN